MHEGAPSWGEGPQSAPGAAPAPTSERQPASTAEVDTPGPLTQSGGNLDKSPLLLNVGGFAVASETAGTHAAMSLPG